MKKKKEFLGRIRPSRDIKTRVSLRNDTVPHRNKKKEKEKKRARKKIKY